MKQKAAAGAAAPGGGRPWKRTRDDSCHGADVISKFHDDILGSIVSFLPTKAGARTQALSKRWCPLWRYAPLNLNADDFYTNDFKRFSLVSKILSEHPGPARSFTFNSIRFHKEKKKFAEEAALVESWFRSQTLARLEELDISFRLLEDLNKSEKLYPLPPSVFSTASTLVVARISFCEFPKEMDPSVNFPLLKILNLWRVSISKDIFHGVISSCHVLESLLLHKLEDEGLFRIRSPTIRSIELCNCFSVKGVLIIEDAPCLKKLLLPSLLGGQDTIRVIGAPKLEVLGPLSPLISEIEIAGLVFQNLTPSSLVNTISTVRFLALQFSVPDLNAVADALRCFPCLEKLYVTRNEFSDIPMNENVHGYDSIGPVECIEAHLQELMFKNYVGDGKDVWFAKYFVLNAKVIKKIKFGVFEEKLSRKGWVAKQQRLVEVETRVSREAQVKFISSRDKELAAHELQIPSLKSS